MKAFQPPDFRPHRLYRGGHLQTLASLRLPDQAFTPDQAHKVELSDGDAIVLHENRPVDSTGNPVLCETSKAIVLVHGLSGCHGSPYMIRWAMRLARLGWTVYRVDMRGCGAAKPFAKGLSHAGRSGDNAAALQFVADRHPKVPIVAAGVSLGGNQLLRLAGRLGAGLETRPDWFSRWAGLIAIAPPIDLVRCSENMERMSRRIYNYYFIRTLFDRIPPGVAQQEAFQAIAAEGRPRTLLELDEQLTAPLSGFSDAMEYYRESSAAAVLQHNPIPTLVLSARDDPIVPSFCFHRPDWPATTQWVETATGGHAGFLGRGGVHWMDECIETWVNQLCLPVDT